MISVIGCKLATLMKKPQKYAEDALTTSQLGYYFDEGNKTLVLFPSFS